MEKKNLFMQPRQILLWNFDATIPLRSAFIFSRVFFLLVAKRRAYLGGMRLGESCCPPIHQQRPTQKGMEGALKRQPWRSRGGPWNTPTRSSGPVTAAATLLHLPPQPPTTMAPASTWKSMWWCQRDGATFSRTHSSVSLGFIKMHRTVPERTVDLERLQSQLWWCLLPHHIGGQPFKTFKGCVTVTFGTSLKRCKQWIHTGSSCHLDVEQTSVSFAGFRVHTGTENFSWWRCAPDNQHIVPPMGTTHTERDVAWSFPRAYPRPETVPNVIFQTQKQTTPHCSPQTSKALDPPYWNSVAVGTGACHRPGNAHVCFLNQEKSKNHKQPLGVKNIRFATPKQDGNRTLAQKIFLPTNKNWRQTFGTRLRIRNATTITTTVMIAKQNYQKQSASKKDKNKTKMQMTIKIIRININICITINIKKITVTMHTKMNVKLT